MKHKKNYTSLFTPFFLINIILLNDVAFTNTLNNQAIQVVSNIFGIGGSTPTPTPTPTPTNNIPAAKTPETATSTTTTNVALKSDTPVIDLKNEILSQATSSPVIANAASTVIPASATPSNTPETATSTTTTNVALKSDTPVIDLKKDILSQATSSPVIANVTSTVIPASAIPSNTPETVSTTTTNVTEKSDTPTADLKKDAVSQTTTNPIRTNITSTVASASSTDTTTTPTKIEASITDAKNSNVSQSTKNPVIIYAQPASPSTSSAPAIMPVKTTANTDNIFSIAKNSVGINKSLIVIDENQTKSDNLRILNSGNTILKDPKRHHSKKVQTNSIIQTSEKYNPVVLPSGTVTTATPPKGGAEAVQFYANHITNQTTEYRDDLVRIKRKLKTVKTLLNRATIEGVTQSIKIQAQLQNELAANEMNIDNTLKEITLALSESNQLISANPKNNTTELGYISKVSSELTVQQQLLEQCKRDNTEVLQTLNESIVLTKKLKETLKPQIDAYDKVSQLNEKIFKNLKQANTAVEKSVKPLYALDSLFGTQNAMLSCNKKSRADCLIRDQHCVWLKAEQECSLKCNAIVSEEACNKVGDGLLCAWNLRGDKGYCYHKY